MKGLLMKELISLKYYGKTCLFLAVFFMVLGIIQQSALAFLMMLSFMTLVLILIINMNSISVDNSTKWDCYAAAMPLNRSDIVKSKYLFSLICAGFCAAVTIPLSFLIGQFFSPISIAEILATVGGVLLALCLILSIVFPLIYKFGAEKSRFIIMGIVVLPSLLPALLQALHVPFPSIEEFYPYSWMLSLIPVVILLLFYASYRLSVRIFQKKEL